MRATGIEVVGSVPWGAHFCQFYETAQDLVDILVPYFAAGLAGNEFCMWVTSEPMHAEEAKAALAGAVGDVEPYLGSGQLEILDYREWYTLGGRFDARRVLQGWVDKLAAAQEKGFEGLRLTGNTFWLEEAGWQDFTEYEAAVNNVIGRYPMLALCTYSLGKCGAPEILDVMSNHAFALIKREGAWQIVESGERRRVEEALRESEARYRKLFENMTDGFAVHEIICDGRGEPVDYRFLDVNPAFERLTGLKRGEVVGRTVREVLPDIEPYWIETYGRAALAGEPAYIENYSARLGRWYEALAYQTAQGRFAAVFSDITERKGAEEALRQARDELEERVRERTAELEEVNRRLKDENRERLRTEELLRLEGVRLDALLGLSQMSGAALDEIAAFTLEQAIALTRSKIGFVGFVSEDESVYTLHAVSKDVVKECDVGGEPMQWHVVDAGIWADAIRQRESLFVNDYSKPHPRKKGLPPGHPYVERFLVVPILEGERIVAVAGVGNKATDYDRSDERQILLLLSGMWSCVERNRSREELQNAYNALESKVGQRTAELGASAAALRESLERLNRAEAIAQLGSWELDLVSEQLSWSDEVYRIFGLAPQEFGATYEAFLEAVHPEDRAAVDAAYRDSLREGKESYEIEHRIVRRGTGEVRWLHEKCEHIRDGAGRIVRSTGMVLDITERKRAEEERERIGRELLDAEEARAALAENLASEISHRTRNNLAIITGLLQMQAGLLPPESPAAVHLRDAVARICTFSVLHGQLHERGRDEVELVEALRRIAEVAREALSKGDTEITVSGDAFICPPQAATNLCVAANELITNALKYGAAGERDRLEIKIRVSREEGKLRLSVWNSGEPVAEGFSREKRATLGLRIVEGLAATRYGGSFVLRPRGHGSEAMIDVEERELFADEAPCDERRFER